MLSAPRGGRSTRTGPPRTAQIPATVVQATPPPAPDVAEVVFGERLPLAERFTAILADSGVSHGLVGPREVPRLWERHVLNCAVVHPAIPEGAPVIDVGSGAGLPGLALAIVRPDLRLLLVEPMLRRTTWLTNTVEELGLDNVEVHRGRAEQFWGRLSAPVVTARAVARLGELARWSLPLLSPGGSMLALEGRIGAGGAGRRPGRGATPRRGGGGGGELWLRDHRPGDDRGAPDAGRLARSPGPRLGRGRQAHGQAAASR